MLVMKGELHCVSSHLKKTCRHCCKVLHSTGRVHATTVQSRSSADEWWLRLRWRWLMDTTLDGWRQAELHHSGVMWSDNISPSPTLKEKKWCNKSNVADDQFRGTWLRPGEGGCQMSFEAELWSMFWVASLKWFNVNVGQMEAWKVKFHQLASK